MEATMSKLKNSKRRSKALPALGFAGVSFSMASGACASIGGASANTPPPSQGNELFLGEEVCFATLAAPSIYYCGPFDDRSNDLAECGVAPQRPVADEHDRGQRHRYHRLAKSRAEIADLLKRTRVYKAAPLSFPCDVISE